MLLDCTLRDGGFVNDWEFGYSSIRSIVSRLDSAGVEIIEVGFIDVKRMYDKNHSIFPDTQSIDKTLSGICINQAKIFAMIDFGTCPEKNIALRNQSIIDGIRIIFKKCDIDPAIDFCSKLKDKGYKVSANPVSLTSYSDKEILCLLDKINDLMPFALSIVDTYGLMLNEDILHFIDLVDRNLDSGILLGYHSHNNQQMAYANCCTILDRRNRHKIIVDASLFGMGKGAGNANIELIASYANKVHGGEYKIEQLLDCIYTDIMRIHMKNPWGYNLQNYMSAINDVHPNYIKFLLEKNTLSIQGIDHIVERIPQERKLVFSQEFIENLYTEYQANSINDISVYTELKTILLDSNILLIFPGSSIKSHEADIKEYIRKNNPKIIAINFIPLDIATDFVFVGNKRRYDRLLDSYHLKEVPPRIIATSNILESQVPITFKLNYESLLIQKQRTQDSSSILCINFLKKLGVKKIVIAGMDGFSHNDEDSFAEPFMDMYISSDTIDHNNAEMMKYMISMREHMLFNFITPSIFEEGGCQR